MESKLHAPHPHCWRTKIAHALFVCTLSVCQAGEPLFGQSSDSSESLTITARDVVARENIEFEIALGRLRLATQRYKILRRHESLDSDRCQRSIHVATIDRKPTLRASYSDPKENWSLQFDPTVGAIWSREVLNQSKPIRIEYRQPPRQPITILVSIGNEPVRTLSQPTLWHMIHENDADFVAYVQPALERLNPKWELQTTLAEAQKYRHQTGLDQVMASPTDFAQAIADLESLDMTVRAQAYQRMRQYGLAAHIPLEHAASGHLSSQQRRLIDQLLVALEPRSADTPVRLAYWLSGDPNWR